MATNCSSSAQISLQKYGSFLKYANKDLKSKDCSVPQKRAAGGPVALRITASIKNKVNILSYFFSRGSDIYMLGFFIVTLIQN